MMNTERTANSDISWLRQRLPDSGKWDGLIFVILTLSSVLKGQTTVFYLIYFFWWNELIRIIIDGLLYPRNPHAIIDKGKAGSVYESLVQMGVYGLFIVVLFGFIANVNNTPLVMANLNVLFFHNWFFNLNLIYVLLERIIRHRTRQAITVHFGSFTPNMIVLHISVVLGGGLLFFVVRKYPEIFTPDNLWGSVLLVLPFLILKLWVGQEDHRHPAEKPL